MVSQSRQDYLQEVYRLQCAGKAASVTALSAKLKISKPSVSEMNRTLEKEGLVRIGERGAVTLTRKGATSALKLLRSHRLLEVLLRDRLKVSGYHQQAHLMEHALSDDAAESLAKFLGDPKTCPDGEHIPSGHKLITLVALAPGKESRIAHINGSEDATRSRLNATGILPNALVRVKRHIRNGPTILEVKGTEIALSNDICRKILVETVKDG